MDGRDFRCVDCVPPEPFATPDWSCTPPGPSAWTSFWRFGCPGDGEKDGEPQCKEWVIRHSKIYCSKNGNLTLTATESVSINLKVPVDGIQIGGSASFSKSETAAVAIDPGEGCGQCVQMWGAAVVCAQRYKNKDDYWKTGAHGFRDGHATRVDCGKDDPIYMTCTDTKITVTDCPRKKL